MALQDVERWPAILAIGDYLTVDHSIVRERFFGQPREHRVSQVIRGRPFQIIDRRGQSRFQPAALPHFRSRQSLAPIDRAVRSSSFRRGPMAGVTYSRADDPRPRRADDAPTREYAYCLCLT